MYFVNRLLSALLLLTFLFGCSSSSDTSNTTPKHHLLIQQKYAAIQAASAHRSKTQGIAFDKHHIDGLLTAKSLGVSTSTVNNGRVVSEETIWLDDNTSVSYVAFSFMSDELLKTGSLPDNKPTATTQVWRHYNNKWCPILAFQPDNQTPLLGFSVASSAAWIEQQNNQVTYRLFVGTAEGKVGKLSFVDTDPKNQFCNETIGFADSETTHAIFYTLGYTNGTPINGMKLAEFQESKSSVNQPLEMDNKRVLYWWGNTSNCTDAKCDNWQAEPAKSALLVNGQLSPSYDRNFYRDQSSWYHFNLDANSVLGNRTNKTKIGDVDLRVKYDNSRKKATMDWAIVYETVPTDKDPRQGFFTFPNITTRSYEFQLNSSEDYVNTAWGMSGLNTAGSYSYHAHAISRFIGDDPFYSATATVSIFDLDNDSNKPYVAVTNSDANWASNCPLIGSPEQCIDMGWYGVVQKNIAANVSVAKLELSNSYKGWGLENIALSASNLNSPSANADFPLSPFPFDASSKGIAIMAVGQANTLSDKRYVQGYDDGKFVTKVPFGGGIAGALDGTVNLGKMRLLLVPDASVTNNPDNRYARLFIILPISDNFIYNPIIDASGKANTKGGLMMCTGKVDLTDFIPPKTRQPQASDLLNGLDCSQEWAIGRDSGYKYAAAEDIILNANYKTSIDGLSLSYAPNNQVLLSYVSASGAILELNISDPNQAWTGQTSWTMISQGRAAACHNEMDKPPAPPEPPSKSFWTKALTKLVPIVGPLIAGESLKLAVEDFVVEAYEVGGDFGCELLGAGPVLAAMCGSAAGKAADLVIDAVDSKARSEGDPYKKLYEETRELTKCTGG